MSSELIFPNVLITGGAGYVGSALVPALLRKGYRVTVLDTFWYGENVFEEVADHPNLVCRKGDIRDIAVVRDALRGQDAVIHLACISNDPSFELDPRLGKSINFDCFPDIVRAAREAGVRRFIYASSSSVYGVKNQPDVREDALPEPLTDYSRFKLACEKILLEQGGDMTRVIVRPATICGYAPRLRLDLTVNILTIHALVNRRIRIFGGKQMRPNLHIQDMVRAYEMFLEAPPEKVDGIPYNVGFENRTVEDIALLVRETLGDEGIELEYVPTDDLRSYHINSDRVRQALGFQPRYTLKDAILSIADAYRAGKIIEPLTNPMYHNIKRMHQLALG